MNEYIIELPKGTLLKDVSNLPLVGRLVRCKDCKYYVGNGADISKLPYWYPCKNMEREQDWFCANGEPKE